MKIARTVAEVLDQHVTLEVECIDRMYLNVYMPQLQHVGGAVQYIRYSSEATVGLDGIDRANQPEVRGIDRAIYRREPHSRRGVSTRTAQR